MDVNIESLGVPVDAWMQQFVRTTVEFAVWHHQLRVNRARVTLEQVPVGAGSRVRCVIEAPVRHGCARGEALAAHACEAVHRAADRLEVDLFSKNARVGTAQPHPVAA